MGFVLMYQFLISCIFLIDKQLKFDFLTKLIPTYIFNNIIQIKFLLKTKFIIFYKLKINNVTWAKTH